MSCVQSLWRILWAPHKFNSPLVSSFESLPHALVQGIFTLERIIYHSQQHITWLHCYFVLHSVIVQVNPPQNVVLSQESSDSLQVTWDHPCDGPPAAHYLITIYACVQFGIAVSTNQEHSLTVPRENTSTILQDLSLTAGNLYIVAVTSIFNNVSTASELVSIHICKYEKSCHGGARQGSNPWTASISSLLALASREYV